jgi:hypothetical protein
MDRIEQLMRNAKPDVAEPPRPALTDPQAVFGRADAGAHAATILSEEVRTFSDDYTDQPVDQPLDLSRGSKRRLGLRVAVAGLAAAAVVVAGNLGSLVPAPAPPAVSSTATGQPTDATPSPSTSPGFPTTGSAECSSSNIFTVNSGAPGELPAPQSKVIGCAGGWMGYSRLEPGWDGGFYFAKLQNGRFVTDLSAKWSTVMSWNCRGVSFDVGMCGVVVTNQEMDERFAAAGIPVELRPQLVGDQPTAQPRATAAVADGRTVN